MIIDCHGHYTTEPKAFMDFRKAQIAHFDDPSSPAPLLGDISDDEILESVENNQLRALKERGADMTIFSPRAMLVTRHYRTLGPQCRMT
jgi:4-oxalmesaconate hydratase